MSIYLIFLTLALLAIEFACIVNGDSSNPSYGKDYSPDYNKPNYEVKYPVKSIPVQYQPQASNTFVQNINNNDLEDDRTQADTLGTDLNDMPLMLAQQQAALGLGQQLWPAILAQPAFRIRLSDLMDLNSISDILNHPFSHHSYGHYNHHNHHNHHNYHNNHNYHNRNHHYPRGHIGPYAADIPISSNRFNIGAMRNENENIHKLTNGTFDQKASMAVKNSANKHDSSYRKLSLSAAKMTHKNDPSEKSSSSSLDLIKSLLDKEARPNLGEASRLDLLLSTLRKVSESDTTTTTTPPPPKSDASLDLIDNLLKQTLTGSQNTDKKKKIAALLDNVLSTLKQKKDQSESKEEIDNSQQAQQNVESNSENEQTETEDSILNP